MNYADLVTLLQDELQSSETSFVANIPNFVRAAEDDVYKNAQISDLRKAATGTLTAASQYLTLPTDFLAAYSLAVVDASTFYFLLNREPEFIRECYPVVATTGRPKYYGIYDDLTFILGPTPTSAYNYELQYYFRPDSIVTTSTSWLGTNAPNTLIYGSFVHGYVYLKGDQDMMQYYRDEYLRALANLQVITEGRTRKDTYRRPNIRQDT